MSILCPLSVLDARENIRQLNRSEEGHAAWTKTHQSARLMCAAKSINVELVVDQRESS